jgi:hypothetical protein
MRKVGGLVLLRTSLCDTQSVTTTFQFVPLHLVTQATTASKRLIEFRGTCINSTAELSSWLA